MTIITFYPGGSDQAATIFFDDSGGDYILRRCFVPANYNSLKDDSQVRRTILDADQAVTIFKDCNFMYYVFFSGIILNTKRE